MNRQKINEANLMNKINIELINAKYSRAIRRRAFLSTKKSFGCEPLKFVFFNYRTFIYYLKYWIKNGPLKSGESAVLSYYINALAGQKFLEYAERKTKWSAKFAVKIWRAITMYMTKIKNIFA
jgi:hypothetical protein